jgi:hypothetical protein
MTHGYANRTMPRMECIGGNEISPVLIACCSLLCRRS